MRRRELRVGLLWHSVNSGNLGIGALTASNIALAREVADGLGFAIRFRILGFQDPGAPIYIDGPDIEMVALNSRSMAPGGLYARSIAGLDCILDIGGGDSFADIYGLKRFAFIWGSKWIALRQRVPLLLSPQTFGPFDRGLARRLAGHAMKGTVSNVARDPLSFAVAQELAPAARTIQSVDVAFALPYERRKRSDSGKPQVGVNVSGLLFNGGYSGGNEFGMEVDYATFTRKLLEAFLSKNVDVHLISHVNSDTLPMDDDRRVADRLVGEMPALIRAPTFTSPSDAKSYISGLDFLVAGRMHACIAAYSSGVPVVPVSYSRKFSGLFQGVLEYEHLVPVKGLSTEEALKFTLDRFADRANLQEQIASGSSRVSNLLDAYRSELETLFQRLAT